MVMGRQYSPLSKHSPAPAPQPSLPTGSSRSIHYLLEATVSATLFVLLSKPPYAVFDKIKPSTVKTHLCTSRPPSTTHIITPIAHLESKNDDLSCLCAIFGTLYFVFTAIHGPSAVHTLRTTYSRSTDPDGLSYPERRRTL
jgi:hypothetical protein